MYRDARYWFLRTVLRSLISPFAKVRYAYYFLIEQSNSLVYALIALQSFGCMYSRSLSSVNTDCQLPQSIPAMILAMLPALFSILQSLNRVSRKVHPQPLLSIAKSSFALLVPLMSGLYEILPNHPTVFLVLFCVVGGFAALSGAWEDVRYDWGLLQSGARPRMLRGQLLYPWTWTYYLAIFSNFVLRFVWVLTLAPNLTATFDGVGLLLPFIFGLCEVFRRFQWNLYRLENDQITNCGNFRPIVEVPLPFMVPEEHPPDEITTDEQCGSSTSISNVQAAPSSFNNDMQSVAEFGTADIVSDASDAARV